MPMSKMLFNESTPSILVSSWFTTVSCTPEQQQHTGGRVAIESRYLLCASSRSEKALMGRSFQGGTDRGQKVWADIGKTLHTI